MGNSTVKAEFLIAVNKIIEQGQELFTTKDLEVHLPTTIVYSRGYLTMCLNEFGFKYNHYLMSWYKNNPEFDGLTEIDVARVFWNKKFDAAAKAESASKDERIALLETENAELKLLNAGLVNKISKVEELEQDYDKITAEYEARQRQIELKISEYEARWDRVLNNRVLLKGFLDALAALRNKICASTYCTDCIFSGFQGIDKTRKHCISSKFCKEHRQLIKEILDLYVEGENIRRKVVIVKHEQQSV